MFLDKLSSIDLQTPFKPQNLTEQMVVMNQGFYVFYIKIYKHTDPTKNLPTKTAVELSEGSVEQTPTPTALSSPINSDACLKQNIQNVMLKLVYQFITKLTKDNPTSF